MLTFVKDKSAVHLVSLYRNKGRSKKAYKDVYFTHSMRKEHQNVAPAAGVLELHRDSLKKLHKIGQAAYDRICAMIDSGTEPDVGEPLRSEYWELLKVYERALRREMYIGDQDALRFELNLPKNKETWGGTFTCIGNSGAGKTRWVVDLCLRYLRATKPHARRTIIWMSPEWEIDKTLKPLKDRRWSFNVIGIDISETALRKSGMDAASYYKLKVDDVIENHGEKALIVMDDFPDGAKGLYPFLRKAYNTMLRTARHRGSGAISLQHTYAGNRNTVQALQSNRHVIFFPRSQQNRCIMFMRDHLMMQIPEARELVLRFAQLDRYMIIQLHSPVCIFNSKYLLLL